MTIGSWLQAATAMLQAAGIGTARLDCLVLLEDVLNTNRTHILAHPEHQITDANQRTLDSMMQRRQQHIPLAYIRGKTEFYGREFIINDYVLEPRPESETMVELLIEAVASADVSTTIVDVGTGSGALAITTKLEIPQADTLAIDIDTNCLQLAKRNAKLLQADITFLSGNLLAPLAKAKLDKPTILLCNLPYVPENFQLNQAATHEPRLAIFGGKDGLDLYRQLFVQVTNLPTVQQIFTESLPPQHESLAAIARAAGWRERKEQDFIQLFERFD
jgi:release factor glutamine methyltransferase